MKKQITLLTFILISTFARANAVEDSLIANIGKKAKVIFYAENKADLNEIAKYDLNKLFAEVRKRSEKNFSNNEEVTLREVDENLKNREVNTKISSKKWLKNMNLNLFVGVSFTDGGFGIFTQPKEIKLPPQYGKTSQTEWISLAGKPSFMLGISSTFDKQLYHRKKVDFSLQYGFGFDLIGGRMKTSINSQLLNSKELSWDAYRFLNDSLSNTSTFSKDSPVNDYLSPNLFTQVMPTLSILNRKGEKVFSIGIGLKAALNLSGIRRTNRLEYISYDTPKINLAYPTYNTLQTAFIANVGYKFINLFIQMQPSIGRAIIFQSNDIGLINNASQGTFSTYIIGLRFGK